MTGNPEDLVFIQAAKEEYLEALFLLHTAALGLNDRGIKFWNYWINPSKEKQAHVKEGCEKGEIYFVEKNKIQVGMVRIMTEDIPYWGPQKEPARYIHSFIVLPRYKGRGIGTEVLKKIETDLIKNKIGLLRLDCNSANTNICKYYESHGFIRVGQKQMPEGLNALYEKQLNVQ